MDQGRDSDDFTSSITPDVMTCLHRSEFFQRLDDLLCPTTSDHVREVCRGDYRLATTLLEGSGFDSTDLEDIFDVLRSQGACCDCEILYNVADSSRLKAEYWKNRAHAAEAKPKHGEDY
jgi:hypothetical protein